MTLMNADFIGQANSEGKASMRHKRVQILENTSDIKKSSQKNKKLIISTAKGLNIPEDSKKPKGRFRAP